MEVISIYNENIVGITKDQMVMVDQLMESKFDIDLLQMMENAGRCLANLVRAFGDEGSVSELKVAVLAGPGGNGGGVIVAARRLYNWGADVSIYTSESAGNFKPIPLKQLNIASRVGIDIRKAEDICSAKRFDIILDGIYGYGLNAAPTGNARTLIKWANNQLMTKVISLDVPSGISLTDGHIFSPTILAHATLTLALPKTLLLTPEVAPYAGKLFLADISVPRSLYERIGLQNDIPDYFKYSDIVRLIR